MNSWVAITTVYLEAWQTSLVLVIGSIFLLFVHRQTGIIRGYLSSKQEQMLSDFSSYLNRELQLLASD
jgi:hypothetical protein